MTLLRLIVVITTLFTLKDIGVLVYTYTKKSNKYFNLTKLKEKLNKATKRIPLHLPNINRILNNTMCEFNHLEHQKTLIYKFVDSNNLTTAILSRVEEAVVVFGLNVELILKHLETLDFNFINNLQDKNRKLKYLNKIEEVEKLIEEIADKNEHLIKQIDELTEELADFNSIDPERLHKLLSKLPIVSLQSEGE